MIDVDAPLSIKRIFQHACVARKGIFNRSGKLNASELLVSSVTTERRLVRGGKSVKANVRALVQIQDNERSFKINMTSEPYKTMLTALIADVDFTDDGDTIYITELDSYANIPVVGKYAYVISDTRQIDDVNTFTPD